jgi:hypothetical protein
VLLLSSGERGAVVPSGYREPFIDVVESDKEIIATAEMLGLEKQDIKINITEPCSMKNNVFHSKQHALNPVYSI